MPPAGDRGRGCAGLHPVALVVGGSPLSEADRHVDDEGRASGGSGSRPRAAEGAVEVGFRPVDLDQMRSAEGLGGHGKGKGILDVVHE